MPASKTGEKALTYAERKRRALELRSQGMGLKEIAEEIGWKSPSSAYEAITKALQETMQEPADLLRRMEAERLDRMLEGLWTKATSGDTWSVDRVLGIMDRRAKLLGLDSTGGEDPAKMAELYLDLYNKAVGDARDRSEA